MAANLPKLCPCCKSTLVVRRWRLDSKIHGEERNCPDLFRCGYESSWLIDQSLGTVSGTTHMRIDSIRANAARDTRPFGMVPGGTA